MTSEYSAHTPPNTNVSSFDAALPGTLPKLNPFCVDLAIRTALALQCDIQRQSSFDRKHYFYSDLPSGYQITQQYAPLAKNGTLFIPQPDGTQTPIRIKQIQLEQDTAKSTFNPRTQTSHIDLNRAGTGLMEIVSEADLRSPEEAAAYIRTLQSLLRAIGSSDGNMEDGSLRCDVNVSINRTDAQPGSGTRCEIKNLNSVKYITAAITHEIHRQSILLTSSPEARVEQETRGFDEMTFETFRLRSKEDAPDYRYMPDPNLGVLRLSQERIDVIRDALPELPWTMRARLKEIYALSDRDVEVLLNIDSGRDVRYDGEDPGESGAVKYFDRLVEGVGSSSDSGRQRDPKVVANWMTHELLGQLASQKKTFKQNTISAAQLGELIDMVQQRAITGTTGKHLIRHMLTNPTNDPPHKIAQDLDLLAFSSSQSSPPSSAPHAPIINSTISTSTSTSDPSPSSIPIPASTSASASASDTDPLTSLCENAIAAFPSVVAAAKKGNKNVLNKIVGAVMRESRGRADAKRVKEVVEGLVYGSGES
ncbi:Glutamyl-tRNA amidotransferase subunit B, mitochondrial [Macrolepiota fuliginosa MF-IS2]|uniref:Glutamyl-tRNA(Gln) amidotransferase subunit B, mitochondrial n=1 Tax=Macrolepiota fuliginosa MF-IS2 TaxID=1400762 RepID=A0A9P6C469_9AGAR|nr:Glutamyl-tRNA amidotransferase subunit B, mitochondrial [Macrolepiota fuliginosa MF-IS2]